MRYAKRFKLTRLIKSTKGKRQVLVTDEQENDGTLWFSNGYVAVQIPCQNKEVPGSLVVDGSALVAAELPKTRGKEAHAVFLHHDGESKTKDGLGHATDAASESMVGNFRDLFASIAEPYADFSAYRTTERVATVSLNPTLLLELARAMDTPEAVTLTIKLDGYTTNTHIGVWPLEPGPEHGLIAHIARTVKGAVR